MGERAFPLATQARADRNVVAEQGKSPDARHFRVHRAAAWIAGRRLRTVAAALAAVATICAVVVAVPAAAQPGGGATPPSSSPAPGVPTTSADAKQRWLDASTKAEAANEDLLTAQQNEKRAQEKVRSAKVALAQANLNADAAQTASVQAAAKYAMYRDDLAQFASASFRGARLGQLSALLTAGSTADYLDEVSSLDQVAGSTRIVMMQALQARDAASAAATTAAEAQDAATAAAAAADKALKDAHDATKAVADRKTALDQQVETYHRLFSALTGQERQAAMQAQQAAWEQQAQQAAQQQAAEQQVAGQAGGQAAAPAGATPAAGSAAGTVTAPNPKAQIAVEAALSKLGAPYVWGATGPNAFDCSGFTSWAWAQAGVTIPRTSSGQASLPVVPLDQLQPGDLVTYYSPTHHVAMYIGNGQIVHASTEGVPVYITSIYRGGPYPVGHRVTN